MRGTPTRFGSGGSTASARLPSVGPACSTMDFKFLEACFKGGLLDYWSAVTVHPYRQTAPETVAAAAPASAALEVELTAVA